MLASNPASMVNQKYTDLGIPNRFNLTPSRFSCVLDRRTDQSPPYFKSGLALRVARRLELRVAEQDGVKRRQDLSAMILSPSDRVGMLEHPVLGVGAVDVEPDL